MAVWSPSTDYLTICLGIACLLAPCLAAPTKTTTTDPWWYNPCNKQVERIRHGRSADQDLVRNQLRTFAGQLNNSILKDLNHLYKDVIKTRTPFRGKLPWLKLKKMITAMKPPKNRLVKFHEALQFFAGTLDMLNHTKIRTNATHFKEEARKNVYLKAADYLKLLLCEVEYTLDHNSQQVPARIPLKRIGVKLPAQLHLTGVHILDLNFFKKLKMFVRRSQRLFKVNKRNNQRNRKSAVNATKRTKVQ